MVRVKVLGSVNSNHIHNPKHIYNPNPNPTLTLNTFVEIEEPVVLSPNGRKHPRTPENHKRAKGKQMRHSGGGKNPRDFVHTKTVLTPLKMCVWPVNSRMKTSPRTTVEDS